MLAEYRYVETDEDWMTEWVDFGFAELQVYLARHAEFARWLIRHGRAHDPAARRG
jgi:hypothetical protein